MPGDVFPRKGLAHKATMVPHLLHQNDGLAQGFPFLDGRGATLVELWLRKEVPVKATKAQIDNGLTYKEVESSTVMGGMRVVKDGLVDEDRVIVAGLMQARPGGKVTPKEQEAPPPPQAEAARTKTE